MPIESGKRQTDEFDITCWYINQRRVSELVPHFGPFDLSGMAPGLSRAKHAIVTWLRKTPVPSIGHILATGEVKVGTVFTHHGDFFCKGLGRATRNESPQVLAQVYAKMDAFKEGLRLRLPFHPEHLTSSSARITLEGHPRLFVLGVVTARDEEAIHAAPYVMGSLVLNPDVKTALPSWPFYREIWPGLIDQFSAMVPRATQSDLLRLKEIEERQIKAWFAEIIHEQYIPSDWGGEYSDLFSTQVSVRGVRVSAAFAFKGPAHFGPLTPRRLGKNGDQLARLFDEPAELLVLQHCHQVTPAVRKTMRAFANQVHDPRYYCVIDGADTARILRGAGKLPGA